MTEERGIALRVGVSGGDDGTMIEMTAIVPEHEVEFMLNRRLDLLVLAGKRQRARCQLPELRHERDATAEVLADNEARLVALEEEFKARTELRENSRAKARDGRGVLLDRFQSEWLDAGKRGQFEPRGGQQAQLTRFDQAIKLIDDEQTKANAEHQVAAAQLENEIKKRLSAVTLLDRRIAECEALAEGRDIFGVSGIASDG